jgi:hypothetical protein
MDLLGKIEVALGLALAGLGWYLMLEHVVAPELDRHAWLVFVGQVGLSLGGLLAFAGAVLAFAPRLRWVGQIPFIAAATVLVAGYGDAFV